MVLVFLQYNIIQLSIQSNTKKMFQVLHEPATTEEEAKRRKKINDEW